ncbi:hypothetical protein Terro_4096 [Terriglobus roseus DSM 18391]|uniref:Lipoprotein n=1 Tax=Terriglobus roseus (strain DSM 18391 / NRRL B-41598 / KBS 63) TaxID=926566 RepID=I3ZM35_TERRK|nr:hypothetical protein Terro_4096 [Terriglobus roseus DSM 18391]
MPNSRNRFLSFVILASFGVGAGCKHAQQPITSGIVVGDYVYISEDPENKASDHNADHLRLQPDGKYDLVQGGSSKPKTETTGNWRIWSGGSNGPRVLLDNSGYPIEIHDREIRLLIDNDVGIWFSKAR